MPAHDVIDGQQRLTTFQIFLAALRDVTAELGVEEISSELHAYTTNTGMMERRDEERFKVWPTLADVPQFRPSPARARQPRERPNRARPVSMPCGKAPEGARLSHRVEWGAGRRART